jgi:hypothetical protein
MMIATVPEQMATDRTRSSDAPVEQCLAMMRSRYLDSPFVNLAT